MQLQTKTVYDAFGLTLLLNVNSNVDIPKSIREAAHGKNLAVKNELHITILGRRYQAAQIEKILKSMESEKEKSTRLMLGRIADGTLWNCQTVPEYYYLRKNYNIEAGQKNIETRQSIIQRVNISSLSLFFKRLQDLLGQKLPVPYPHLTLFTAGTVAENRFKGIGIESERDFFELKPQKISIA
jgi:hypothetical protein